MANFLYNGVELPDINEVWTDKVKYPYAYMEMLMQNPLYTALVLISKPMFCKTNSHGDLSSAYSANTQHAEYMLAEGGNSWSLTNSGTWNTEGNFSTLGSNTSALWANYDVINTDDNSIYLAASDPVPVGGEPEQPETTSPDYAIIPMADYKAACDAIRAKTGKTDLIKSGEMAGEIGGIEVGGSTGGGQVELVEGAVYKAQESRELTVYLVLGGMAVTVSEYFAMVFGSAVEFPCYIVDTLPDTMESGCVYIVSSSGIAYMSDDGTSSAAYTIGSALSLTDKGWVDDITSIDATDEANAGVYCQRGGLIEKYYTYTDGAWTEKGEVSDTDSIVVVDDNATYIKGDKVYLHDEKGWKGYKIADKYFECTLDISKDTLTLPAELVDALLSNSFEKTTTDAGVTITSTDAIATFITNSHIHSTDKFDTGTLDYSRIGSTTGMALTICMTNVASNRDTIHFIYFNQWDGANTLTFDTATKTVYDKGDTITQTVTEIDRSGLTAVKCTFTIHTAERLT